ncbi:GNAT family N-acetyltransferase [Gammaproteobacteria bacterium AS21]
MDSHFFSVTPLFKTKRLQVIDTIKFIMDDELSLLLNLAVIQLLSPEVVKSLPCSFHHINNSQQAAAWLERMQQEGQVLVVVDDVSKAMIGFVFLFQSNDNIVHLGYLLGELYWSQGYGYELLTGLLLCCKQKQLAKTLVAGVDSLNVGSARLLEKVGFIADNTNNDESVFYQYDII